MANNKDYIPTNEEDFNDWQDNFEDVLVANAVAWGVPPATVTLITNAKADWEPKYAAGKDEADPKSAQRQAKNDSKKAYKTKIRKAVNESLRNNPALSNDDRISLGITVADSTRTRVPVPDHAPKEAIEKIDHLFHILRITDPDSPNTKAKPEGVARINVYRYIGTTPPTSINQYQFISSATKFLFTSTFNDEEVGKKAYYITQYENTRGERGPLSDVVSATIA